MDPQFYGKLGRIRPVTQAYYESEKLFFGSALAENLARFIDRSSITGRTCRAQIAHRPAFPDEGVNFAARRFGTADDLTSLIDS